jgi:antitoxin PrlF
MSRISRQPATFSKLSIRSRTVIPREVRGRLKLMPGDVLRYRMTDDGILLDKVTEADDGPFCYVFGMDIRGRREGLWRIVVFGHDRAKGAGAVSSLIITYPR